MKKLWPVVYRSLYKAPQKHGRSFKERMRYGDMAQQSMKGLLRQQVQLFVMCTAYRDKGLREDKLLDNLGDTAGVVVKRGDVVCLAFKLFGGICHEYAKAGRFNHG